GVDLRSVTEKRSVIKFPLRTRVPFTMPGCAIISGGHDDEIDCGGTSPSGRRARHPCAVVSRGLVGARSRPLLGGQTAGGHSVCNRAAGDVLDWPLAAGPSVSV